MGSLNQELARQTVNKATTVLPTKQNTNITEAEVKAALKAWGEGLVSIAKAYANKQNHKDVAIGVIKNSYAYHMGEVLFKPTLASKVMFRKTFDSALSYFIGNDSNYTEDRGFALNPWMHVDFDLAGIKTGTDYAMVMGNKLLTDKTGKTTIANFTMGFIKDKDGSLKINLHHSSLPYQA